jgi:hypothetical protein
MPNNQLKGKSEADTIMTTLGDRRETAPHAKSNNWADSTAF